VLGPAALWDDPASKPRIDDVIWADLERTQAATFSLNRAINHHRRPSFYRITKRIFDLIFSVLAIVLTSPMWPVVMLAIWLEDGGPFFFLHTRETIGGREFPLIKFRSMRKDAEASKKNLASKNKADGPQFYMPGDPRITRVGRIIRRWNIDEIPQFINVLLGQMSLVGPRPSPHKENQFCPPWRDARLSVRPGITGLWQVKRTREHGRDFQEWIRYDLQYVQHASWRMDISIMFKTLHVLMFWN
jgi:lipopolysaccharide/colanic/teichoic acid biosynthesis glycosyltransferase